MLNTPPTFDPDAICITSDVEWAHPEVLDYLLRLLDERNLRATLFCTHPGIVAPRHELALHPNFSFQGNTMRGIRQQLATLTDKDVHRHVIETTCAWYPSAIGVRGHRLFFDSALLPLYQQKGIQYDSGCYLPLARNIEPAMRPYNVLELPIYLIDYSDLADNRSGFEIKGLNLSRPGLKVFNFHPNIVFINAESLPHYLETKAYYHDLKRLTAARNHGRGIGTLFIELLDHLADHRSSTMTLSEVNAAWRAGSGASPTAAESRRGAGVVP